MCDSCGKYLAVNDAGILLMSVQCTCQMRSPETYKLPQARDLLTT